MANETVNFYLYTTVDPHDGESQIVDSRDLEVEFAGLRYAKCVGLHDKGEIKNIYTEEYADSDELRVYVPETIHRKNTELTFTFYFIGETRQASYEAFCNYASQGIMWYYDTKRLKKAKVILKEKLKPTEEVSKGNKPYLCADFKFINLWGECKRCDIDGHLI